MIKEEVASTNKCQDFINCSLHVLHGNNLYSIIIIQIKDETTLPWIVHGASNNLFVAAYQNHNIQYLIKIQLSKMCLIALNNEQY